MTGWTIKGIAAGVSAMLGCDGWYLEEMKISSCLGVSVTIFRDISWPRRLHDVESTSSYSNAAMWNSCNRYIPLARLYRNIMRISE